MTDTRAVINVDIFTKVRTRIFNSILARSFENSVEEELYAIWLHNCRKVCIMALPHHLTSCHKSNHDPRQTSLASQSLRSLGKVFHCLPPVVEACLFGCIVCLGLFCCTTVACIYTVTALFRIQLCERAILWTQCRYPEHHCLLLPVGEINTGYCAHTRSLLLATQRNVAKRCHIYVAPDRSSAVKVRNPVTICLSSAARAGSPVWRRRHHTLESPTVAVISRDLSWCSVRTCPSSV